MGSPSHSLSRTIARRNQARDAYSKTHNAEEVTRLTGIPVSTVRRYCKDLIDKDQERVTSVHSERDNKVIALRQAGRVKGFKLRPYAEAHGFKFETAAKALRGYSFKHLDKIEPPVLRTNKKPDEQVKARYLYSRKKKGIKAIAKELGVSQSSVAMWCRDLIDQKREREGKQNARDMEALRKEARILYQKPERLSVGKVARAIGVYQKIVNGWLLDLIEKRRQLVKNEREQRDERLVAQRALNGPQLLTNKMVLDTRKAVRESGKKGWRTYADLYNVSVSVISMAVRGVTFKHLNSIEPPVFADDPPAIPGRASGNRKKLPPDETLIAEAVKLMRSDPVEWTYAKLAEWMREKTKRGYKPNHMATVMRNRDPSLREIEPKQPEPVKKEPVKKKAKPPKVVKPPKPKMTPEEIKAKAAAYAAARRKEREELRRMIEEEDRYEATRRAA